MRQDIFKAQNSFSLEFVNSSHPQKNQSNQNSLTDIKNTLPAWNSFDQGFFNSSKSSIKSLLNITSEHHCSAYSFYHMLLQEIKQSREIKVICAHQNVDGSISHSKVYCLENIYQQSYQMSPYLKQQLQQFNAYHLKVSQMDPCFSGSKQDILDLNHSQEILSKQIKLQENKVSLEIDDSAQQQSQRNFGRHYQSSQKKIQDQLQQIIHEGIRLYQALLKYTMDLQQKFNLTLTSQKQLTGKLEQTERDLKLQNEELSVLKNKINLADQCRLKQQKEIEKLKASYKKLQEQNDQLKLCMHTSFSQIASIPEQQSIQVPV